MNLISPTEFRRRVKANDPTAGLTLRKEYQAPVEVIGDRALRFTISTATVDRMGDTIAVDGWELSDFRRNPVVLWAHRQDRFPVGRAVDIAIDGGALKATVEFALKRQDLGQPFREYLKGLKL